MEVKYFISYRQEYINKVWLYNWKIKVSEKQKRSLGLCDQTNKELRFSKFLIENETELEIKNTLIHEVAHAMVGNKEWHWRKWIEMAKFLWLKNPKTYNTSAKQPPWLYIMQCPNCKEEISYFKKVKKTWKGCLNCCVKFNYWKFDKKFEFIPINF